jgi:hypothetical protein
LLRKEFGIESWEDMFRAEMEKDEQLRLEQALQAFIRDPKPIKLRELSFPSLRSSLRSTTRLPSPHVQRAARQFQSLAVQDIVRLRVPEKRRAAFAANLEKTRDEIADLVLNREAFDSRAPETIRGRVNELRKVLTGLTVEDVRTAAETSKGDVGRDEEHSDRQVLVALKEGSQQEIYDSLKLFLHFVLFRAVLDAFPPSVDSIAILEAKNHQTAKKEWDRGLRLFLNYIQHLSTVR